MRSQCFFWLLMLPLYCLGDDPTPRDANVSARAGTPGAAFDNERYQLGYQVYLAHGDLSAAFQVALKATQSRPDDAEWLRRLARTAEWVGEPALALNAWLRLARRTDDQQAWAAVGRLAPGLLNDAALLEYQKKVLEKQGINETIIKNIAQTYERLGQADQGLDYFQQLAGKNNEAYVLNAEATLAEHTAHDTEAKGVLERLIQQYGPHEDWLLRLVAIEYTHGDLATAWNTLHGAEPKMPHDATGFWQTYAEISNQMNHPAEARAAYQILIDSGKAQLGDLTNYISLLEPRDALAAAHLSETAFSRFDDDSSLISALYLYTRENQLNAAQHLLDRLTPVQRHRLEQNADFIGHRAQLEWQQHKYAKAHEDFVRALQLSPRNVDYLQDLVLVVTEQKDMAELSRIVDANMHYAQTEPQLWNEWGTAFDLLDEPQRAIPFLRAYCHRNPNDMLGLLELADGYDKAGDKTSAEALRRKVIRSGLGSNDNSPERASALKDALLALRLEQAPPDPALQMLRERLKPGPDGKVDPVARQMAMSWLLAHGGEAKATDLVVSGPLQDRPGWAQVSATEASQDEGAMERMLTDPRQALSKGETMEMTEQVAEKMDWPMLEQTTVFEELEQNPEDTEALQRFRELTEAQARWVEINGSGLLQGELERDQGGVSWSGPWGSHWRLQAGAGYIAQRSRNTTLLSSHVPSGARESLELQHTSSDNGWQFTVANTHLLTDYGSATLAQEYHPVKSLELDWQADYNADAPESAALLAVGAKDQVSVGANWKITPAWFLNGEILGAEFHGQEGHHLGDGSEAIAEAGRHFSLGTIGQTLKLQGSVTHFTADNKALPPALLALIPPGGNATTSRFFVPVGYRQIAAFWDIGEPSPEMYRSTWSGFAELGSIYANTTQGGYAARLGFGGPLMGHDRLNLSVEQEKSGQGNGGVIKQAIATYRYFY